MLLCPAQWLSHEEGKKFLTSQPLRTLCMRLVQLFQWDTLFWLLFQWSTWQLMTHNTDCINCDVMMRVNSVVKTVGTHNWSWHTSQNIIQKQIACPHPPSTQPYSSQVFVSISTINNILWWHHNNVDKNPTLCYREFIWKSLPSPCTFFLLL